MKKKTNNKILPEEHLTEKTETFAEVCGGALEPKRSLRERVKAKAFVAINMFLSSQ